MMDLPVSYHERTVVTISHPSRMFYDRLRDRLVSSFRRTGATVIVMLRFTSALLCARDFASIRRDLRMAHIEGYCR